MMAKLPVLAFAAFTLPFLSMNSLANDGSANTGSAPSDGLRAGRPLRVLAIGNSFSKSLCPHLPAAAAAAGERLEFCNLYIGGCSLLRHADNLRKEEEDPTFAPYVVDWFAPGGGRKCPAFNGGVRQMLSTQAWDVVTIQQASPGSWRPETYFPAADQVVAAIRKLAPGAEIVVQQTWAYNAADGRIGGDSPAWGIDQSEMFSRLAAAYNELAGHFGEPRFRIIPTGQAVQNRRAALAAEGRGFNPSVLEPGHPIDLRGEPVGNNLHWEPQKDENGNATGKFSLAGDMIHFNGQGQYLQAIVWTAFLFNRDAAAIPYAPESVGSAETCAALRAAAAAALKR